MLVNGMAEVFSIVLILYFYLLNLLFYNWHLENLQNFYLNFKSQEILALVAGDRGCG